ncbi:GlsB/YeaQ/YmgE family stress response membrane protein [Luteimonas saliphila]|uniref:GlsB/YeaQ/YmgE family stress response membrane protein n=1 Tax=Luteimonas saliphila TaxID=2804919 RepID=UPI00192D3910|nr:GlsB/YeaQ/YmgE family stress response membrane protein [Luteimonas saliphila]
MNFIIYLIVGGIAGWLASILMRTDGQQGIILNVVVGIIGGFIGGWLLPMVGFGLGGGWIGFLITALIGAIVLLAIVNLFRRGSVR